MTKKMDLFLQNKYSKTYFRIIEQAKNRKLDNIYVEEHHILPKSLGGNNSEENLVLLTAREHFICHLLLVKSVSPIYKKKMNYAFWRMCNGSKNRYKPTARFYALGKQAFIESQMGHPSYMVSQSKESRDKIGKSMSITLLNLTEIEMKERMLNSCCNPSVYTKARAEKISKSMKGKTKSISHKINLSKRCVFISPDNEKFYYDGLNIGCKVHNFNYGSVKNNIMNNQPYKGWRILYG